VPSTGCEWGQKANKLPPGVAGWQYTDPLYLEIPWGPLLKQNRRRSNRNASSPATARRHDTLLDRVISLKGSTLSAWFGWPNHPPAIRTYQVTPRRAP
jgi:hypothetical protein